MSSTDLLEQSERSQNRKFYLNSLIGGIALYSLSEICRYQYLIHASTKEIVQAERTKVYTPDVLLKKIKAKIDLSSNATPQSSTSSREKLQSFKSSPNNPNILEGRVFLTGIVKCEKPLLQDNHVVGNFRMKGLIYKLHFDEDKYSLSQRSDATHYFPASTRSSIKAEKVDSFTLVDQFGKSQCEVSMQSKQIDVSGALQLIGQKDRILQLTYAQKTLSTLVVLVNSFIEIISGGKSSPLSRTLKGVRVAVTEKEIGIKVDSILSVFGSIIYDKTTGKLSFAFPEAIINDKNSMIYSMKKKLLELRFYRKLFAFTFLAASSYFLFKAVNKYVRTKGNPKQPTIIQ